MELGYAGMRHLEIDQYLRNDTYNSAAGSERSIRYCAHQSHPRAAIDEPETTLAEGLTDLLGCRPILRPCSSRRSTENRNSLRGRASLGNPTFSHRKVIRRFASFYHMPQARLM
jgi:hypothetical protein